MNNIFIIARRSALLIFVATFVSPVPTWSDTLVLRNGTTVPGHLIGAGNDTITFADCTGRAQSYSVGDVEAVQFDDAPNRPRGATDEYNRQDDNGRNNQGCFDQSRMERVTLPAGTEVAVRTNERIDSRDVDEGQTFSAQIAEDINGGDGSVLIPRGSDASLITRRVEQNGDISLDVESVTVAGRRYRVSTADQEVDNRGDNLGANKRTGKFVGGGAALGAIIGAIAGGGKGAAIGAVAGAGAGAGTQIITRGKEVHVPAETVLRFRLDHPLRLQLWS